MGNNYFNSIPWREARLQLGHCRSMAKEEFADGVNALKGKKIVIVGCGAQGLNQGMCLRDSGLDVSYALRDSAIAEKRQSYKNAVENGFKVGTYAEMIPTADLVGKAIAGNASVTLSWNYSVDDTAGGYYLYYGTRPGEYLCELGSVR